MANGEAVEAIAEEGDWVSVNYEGTKGYVAKEYVKVVFDIDKAESMAVIKAREEAERVLWECFSFYGQILVKYMITNHKSVSAIISSKVKRVTDITCAVNHFVCCLYAGRLNVSV